MINTKNTITKHFKHSKLLAESKARGKNILRLLYDDYIPIKPSKCTLSGGSGIGNVSIVYDKRTDKIRVKWNPGINGDGGYAVT